VKKVVIKILQGSVITQTTLGGLTIYPPVANFPQCVHAKNYENWLAVDKVIAKIIRLSFFGPPWKFLHYVRIVAARSHPTVTSSSSFICP